MAWYNIECSLFTKNYSATNTFFKFYGNLYNLSSKLYCKEKNITQLQLE